MLLPLALQQAIESVAYQVPMRELGNATAQLIDAYRGRTSLPSLSFREPAMRAAYAVVRMPATFAAVTCALGEVLLQRPDFVPTTLLDVGTGPGTALWGARECFHSLRSATCMDQSPELLGLAQQLWGADTADDLSVRWQRYDARSSLPDTTGELVTAAYVLNEIPEARRVAVLEELWKATGDTLLIVEPGTTEGFEAMLGYRDWLLTNGAHLIGPCSHKGACPLEGKSWCHFNVRFNRSSRHRQAKGGTLGYEDEKFLWLAVSKVPAPIRGRRILMAPVVTKAEVELMLCTANDPTIMEIRKDPHKDAYKSARRLDWGDVFGL